jgi:peroxiredoxin
VDLSVPLAVGTNAPAFTLVSQDREKVSLEDLKGRRSMIVFMPYPHTRVCEGEACEIRDNWAAFEGVDATVVMITTHAGATNRDWAKDNGFRFPILSDYWPHGEVSRAYDTFDETYGYAKRTTYILDAEGVIRDVIATDVLGEARPFTSYIPALEAIG